jgi:hypothetical protein
MIKSTLVSINSLGVLEVTQLYLARYLITVEVFGICDVFGAVMFMGDETSRTLI